MKNQVLLFITLVILSTYNMSSQTQIGSDIDGLLAGDNFGTDVSISSDGTIVAASAYGTPNEDSRLRVFKNVGGVWTLYGTDSEGGNFGGTISYSVSLSADGHTLAVGTFTSVKIFSYNSNTGFWTPKGNVIPNNTVENEFGYSIKLSSDGNTIVIGSVSTPIVPNAGVTQIFEFETNSWNQLGDDIDGLVFAEHSGRSVDISEGGKTVAILNNNSARVYKYITGSWTLYGNEIPAFGSDYPNRAISLSSDGTILAIGEPDFTDSLIQRGRVRVFSYELGVWNQVGSAILGEFTQYRTGVSVSLSSDGQVLAIGESGSTSSSTDSGRTRIFENQNGIWTQIGSSIFGEANEDYSGQNVSLSSDATTVIIGASLNDGNGVDSGHVRVYDLNETLLVNDFIQSEISLFPNPAISQFTIKLQEGNTLNKVTIYNCLGEFIFATNRHIIDTSEMSSGIYFVDIATSKGKTLKKLIIN
jgi:hypothetical protein